MKSLLALFASILCFCSWLAHASQPLTVHASAAARAIEVSLPANPTTGYQWRLKQFNRTLLQLQSQRFVALKGKLMGAGGQSVFIFLPRQGQALPKQTELLFTYVRPWDPASADDKNVIIKFD